MPINIFASTVAKVTPLVIAAGSLFAYAATTPTAEPQRTGSISFTEQETGASATSGSTTLATTTASFISEAVGCSYAQPATVRPITLASTSGDDSAANAATLAAAIATAKIDLASNPNTTIVLQIASGAWEIGGTATGAINLDGVNDGVSGTGWLVISGDTMQNTTLNFTNYQQQGFKGNNVYRLRICNLHLTRAQETVTQGNVLGFLPDATWTNADGTAPSAPWGDEILSNVGSLDTSGAQSQTMVVDLHAGFPDLNAVYDTSGVFNCQGRYLRKYRYAGTTPVLVLDKNPIQPWILRTQITGTGTSLDGKWAVRFGRPRPGTNDAIFVTPGTDQYAVNDQVAIKSKKTRDAMFFAIGSDIAVENVRLTRATRMAFRGGTVEGATMDHVRLTNIAIERMPAIGGKIPFISSAEGGPQFFGLLIPATPTPPPSPPPHCPAGSGEPTQSTPMSDAIVENSDIAGTGDDGIGAFNVNGLSVTSTGIEDALGRGMAFANGSTTPCIRALIHRNPIYSEDGADFEAKYNPPATFYGCRTDSLAPAAVTSLAADTTVVGRIRLTWTSSNPPDWDGFRVRRRWGTQNPEWVVIGLRNTAYNDVSVKSGRTYTYEVTSFDKSRNVSTITSITETAP